MRLPRVAEEALAPSPSASRTEFATPKRSSKMNENSTPWAATEAMNGAKRASGRGR